MAWGNLQEQARKLLVETWKKSQKKEVAIKVPHFSVWLYSLNASIARSYQVVAGLVFALGTFFIKISLLPN